MKKCNVYPIITSLLIVFIVAISSFAQTIIVPYGATWKYLDDGSDQGTSWSETGFNDALWAEGIAEFGYNEGDEATVVSYGPSSNDKHITTYFRHYFDLENPLQTKNLLLNLLRDDGAVVYLNGSEIVRSNIPPGDVNYQTLASSSGRGSHQYLVSAGNLVAGTNVLSVETHLKEEDAKAMSFNMELATSDSVLGITRKAPYLIYTGVNSEMQILWQSNYTYSSNIEWGTDTDYSMGNAQTREYGNDHQHRYKITDLKTSTKYYYRVIVETDTFTGNFYTGPKSEATKTTFLAYGDTRSNPADHDKVAERIIAAYQKDENAQTIIINSGDLVRNGDDEEDWDRQFFDPSYKNIQKLFGTLPYLAAMGNHEKTGQLFAKYYPHPFYTDRYYWSFDYGPAHIVIIDQYTPYSSGSAQYQWLENDLSATGKHWKFIIMHEPGWSAKEWRNNEDVQKYIQPLCKKYGIQMVIVGHNHFYARAYVDGVVHITSGGGGAGLYDPDPTFPNLVIVNKSHHFCKIAIDGDSLQFTAIKHDGEIIDEFSLVVLPDTEPLVSEDIPQKYELFPAHPNPFNSDTAISFSLPKGSKVELTIYDINGKKIRKLVNTGLNEGRYNYLWNGQDDSGKPVSSGTYICKIQTESYGDSYSDSIKVVLLK